MMILNDDPVSEDIKKYRKAVNEETQRLLNFHRDSNVEFIFEKSLLLHVNYSSQISRLVVSRKNDRNTFIIITYNAMNQILIMSFSARVRWV